MKRRHFIALAGAAWATRPAQAAAILDHQVKAGPRAVDLPQSAFHAWQAADADADKVVERWKTEPLTVPWTRIQLDRHVKHKIMPTRGARGLALVHVAMHDGLELARQHQEDPRLVVSMAAAQVLGYLFSNEEKAFDRIAHAVAARVTGQPVGGLAQKTLQALALGEVVGQRVVRHGETDGAQRGWNGVRLQYYGEGRYYGPSAWEPTPPYFYYPPDEPFAPSWGTWALERADEFRPTPPPFGSPRYVADLEEVIRINKDLTPEQLKVARFWVDGHGSVTPPGHWNNIAIDEALAARLDDVATARLFVQLNMAMADSFIACWDAKYHYWTARPITAAKRVLNVKLAPPILTPPFPSYVSGHATFSGAAARVLGAYVPKETSKLTLMAEEAAHSRLLGGIHFRHDNEDGLILGRRIADKVMQRFAMQA